MDCCDDFYRFYSRFADHGAGRRRVVAPKISGLCSSRVQRDPATKLRVK